LLQSPKPVAQAILHAPFAQLGVPWFELQALLQSPQLATSALTARSQPSVWLVLQLAQPLAQVATWHAALTHC
jgi:hypothetical protein